MWKWCLFFYPIALFSGLNTQGDWQLWTKDGVKGKITDSTNWSLGAEERFGNGCSTLYHWFIEALIRHKWDETWSSELGYRDNHRLNNGEWREVPSPFTTLTFKKNILRFRQRWSYEFNQKFAPHTSWEYRQRLELTLPWKWTGWKIQPFISDEVFFRKQQGYTRNRFQSGIRFSFLEKWEGELYYMLQSTRGSGEWVDVNVANVNLYRSF